MACAVQTKKANTVTSASALSLSDANIMAKNKTVKVKVGID